MPPAAAIAAWHEALTAARDANELAALAFSVRVALASERDERLNAACARDDRGDQWRDRRHGRSVCGRKGSQCVSCACLAFVIAGASERHERLNAARRCGESAVSWV